MKNIFLSFLICITFFFAGQSLFGQAQIYYESDIEKHYFTTDLQNIDSWELALLYKSNLTRTEIEKCKKTYGEKMAKLNFNKLANTKNPKKGIEYLQKFVESEFIREYNKYAGIYELITEGKYNTVNLSILYHFILREANIPFTVNENPDEVFITVYPNHHNITLHTISENDQKLYLALVINEFVQYLLKIGKVSELDYMGKSGKQLFEEHYFLKDSLTFTELIGVQYLYLGTQQFSNENYEKAFTYFQKSAILHECIKTSYLQYSSIDKYLNTANYGDANYIDFLIRALDFKAFGITEADVVKTFKSISQVVLLEENQFDQYESSYNKLITGSLSESAKADVSFIYNSYYAQVYAEDNKLQNAIKYAYKAMQQEPSDSATQAFYLELLEKQYVDSVDFSSKCETFEDIFKRFTILESNYDYQRVYITALLKQAVRDFKAERVQDALKRLTDFEGRAVKLDYWPFDNFLISDAYIAAAMYYFKYNQVSKSQQMIERGLKIYPDSRDLKTRKEMLNKI